jgi:pyruvate dehydrogenase (quinone)
MPRALEIAITRAIGQQGVAVIVIPGDIALQRAEDSGTGNYQKPVRPLVCPSEADLDRLAEMLNEARRVTLFCGAGCARARAEVLNLAEKLKSPIVHALRGKEYLEYDNPYDVGLTAVLSDRGQDRTDRYSGRETRQSCTADDGSGWRYQDDDRGTAHPAE